MAKEFLPFFPISSKAKVIDIKENVSMIIQDGQKFILKKKRKSSRFFFDLFRHKNEIRIYQNLHSDTWTFLNVPEAFIEKESGNLILSLIKIEEEKEIDYNDFSLAYHELQCISPKKQLFLDIYVLVFLSFFYRIGFVSLFTISRKVNVKTAIKSFLLFIKLNLQQRQLKDKYWIHGDFYKHHFFYNNEGNLFFIDFENMFWTRKWPLAEIIGQSFRYDSGKVFFSPLLVHTYLKNISTGNELKALNLSTQFRFALLQHSIREIAHTKAETKRKEYIKILHMTLNKREFENWYNKFHL